MEEKEGKNEKIGANASNEYSPKPISVTEDLGTNLVLVSEEPLFGHLKRVRLNPECYKRHYPPHRPWYVSPEYNSLNPGMAELEWIVAECPGNPELYMVYFGNRKYYIEKEDCI